MKLLAGMLVLVILIGGVVDLPRSLTFGSITGLGFLTIFYAAASWFLVVVHARIPRAASVIGWFVLFLAWSFTSLIWHPIIFTGVQNLLTYTAFVGLLLLSAMESYQNPHLSRYVGVALAWAALIACSLFGASVLLGVDSNDSANFVVSQRSFGMFALLGIGWYLAGWRYGSRNGLWLAIAGTLLIGLSLSRMALFAALVLFPLAKIQLNKVKGWMQMILWIALVAGLSYLTLTYVESIRARFMYGDMTLQVGGIAVNGSGRYAFWQATLASFWESPWIGKGSGSSQSIVASATKIPHPHNDYLRILHDFGVIGLGLWLLGFWGLVKTVWRAWRWADRNGNPQARLHLAAFLALAAVAMMMVTDNIVIYTFVMAPFGVLVGTSLGAFSRERVQVMDTTAVNFTRFRNYGNEPIQQNQ